MQLPLAEPAPCSCKVSAEVLSGALGRGIVRKQNPRAWRPVSPLLSPLCLFPAQDVSLQGPLGLATPYEWPRPDEVTWRAEKAGTRLFGSVCVCQKVGVGEVTALL